MESSIRDLSPNSDYGDSNKKPSHSPILGQLLVHLTMWPDRRLIDILQIEHPILLAPMATVGTVDLAAAVCAAGGLGSIACAVMEPEVAGKTIRALRGLTE